MFEIPLLISFGSDRGGACRREPITGGVPLPRGAAGDADGWALITASGQSLPVQTIPTDRWPDGSIRWLLIDTQVDRDRELRLVDKGIKVIQVNAADDGRVDVVAAAKSLGVLGLTRVLVEGGGQVAAAILKAGLIDRITHYRAGLVMGADSRSAVGPMGLDRLGFAPRFSLVSARTIDGDAVESWRRDA